jgi:hypothetical protein
MERLLLELSTLWSSRCLGVIVGLELNEEGEHGAVDLRLRETAVDQRLQLRAWSLAARTEPRSVVRYEPEPRADRGGRGDDGDDDADRAVLAAAEVRRRFVIEHGGG